MQPWISYLLTEEAHADPFAYKRGVVCKQPLSSCLSHPGVPPLSWKAVELHLQVHMAKFDNVFQCAFLYTS